MTQNDLNRSVAHATGENISEISRRGFTLLTPRPYEFEPEDESLEQYLDWDEVDLSRNVPLILA